MRTKLQQIQLELNHANEGRQHAVSCYNAIRDTLKTSQDQVGQLMADMSRLRAERTEEVEALKNSLIAEKVEVCILNRCSVLP
jgi:hypothetical protein